MIFFLKKSWPFLLLAVLSFTVHFAFLTYPAQVVFDEVHFGKFVAAYFTGQYYFDIHPPLGKLMIAGLAKLTDVNPIFAFDKIGDTIPAAVLFWLRFLPAFCGGLFVLFFAWLAYLLSRSRKIALIAGFLLLADNGFLVQSKFILVDIFLIAFEILTLCFFLLWQRQKPYSTAWFFYLSAAGIFFGLAASVKWTGLAVIGIIGLTLLTKIFSRRLQEYLNSPTAFAPTRKRLLRESLTNLFLLALIGGAIYILPFYAHFKLLKLSGPGDDFMSPSFQSELKYGRENVYQPLSFGAKFLELNKTMLKANASITAEHPFGSRWFNWPFNRKPVYYWNQDGVENRAGWRAKIYFSGNFLLWWLGAAVLITAILKSLFGRGRQETAPIFYILLIGITANLFPFIFIKRVAFLYHYLPTAIFIDLAAAVWLADFWPRRRKCFIATTGLIILTFILLTPFSYGWSLPPAVNNPLTALVGFFN